MPIGKDQNRLVEETANRLRMIQLDRADEAPDARQEYMASELERTIAGLPEDGRAGFLDDLLSRFPSWGVDAVAPAPAPATNSHEATDERELRDADFLVARLEEIAADIGGDERKALSKRLAAAGLGVKSKGTPERSTTTSEALSKTLRVRETDALDAGRVADGLDLFADMVFRLDKVVWQAWQEFSPRSRRAGKLKEVTARFATGKPDAGRDKVKSELDELLARVAALVSGIQSAARSFGERHENKFSVEAIKRAVDMEGGKGGIFGAKEALYWKKYCELAADLNRRKLEQEIRDAVAEFTERMMEGTRN